jgi:acyl-coenzyme A synthetase/AMP-(fatty) acid ligase
MAAAIGFPDKIYGDVVWLAVVLKTGKQIDENEIINLCKEQLADFKVPKKIIFEKELPITRLGKIDRPTLRNMYINSMK